MKNHRFLRFATIHTAIATTLALSSAAQSQTLYWDTNGISTTPTAFGNFAGDWNGVATNWNTSSTGGAGTLSATTTSSNALIIAGGGTTGIINLSTNQSAASLDFANTANLAALQLADGASLTLTGAITDTGAGNSDIRIVNTSLANAATKLVATSVASGPFGVTAATGGVAQFFTSGYNMTIQTQYSIGSIGGNTTVRQTAGFVDVNAGTDRGFVFAPGADNFANSALYTSSYILDGGTMRSARIGSGNFDGQNLDTNRWAPNGRLEFNGGTIASFSNATLVLQNGAAFGSYTGSGTKDMQFNTSKPFNIELAQTGTHTLNADGATGRVIVTPSAQLVNKAGEAGTLNKTGLGNLIFTGGGPVAVNSYTGSTTVTAGTVSTDYSIIAGQAVTGGTANLSNGFSAASQLVLNGGNYAMTGRSSADASSATGISLAAGTARGEGVYTITVGSTAGMVVGQSVTNANLPAGTYIRQILSSTQIQLNAMSTSTTTQTGQTLNFGAASFNNTQTINSVAVSQAATVTVTPGAGTSTTLLSFGDVSGSGALTKSGAGTLRLTGAVTHSGTVNVTGGTIEFASNSNQTYTTNVTGSVGTTLIKSGNGTLRIANSGTGSVFNGAVIVNGGVLSNGPSAGGLRDASSYTINNGGTMQVDSSSLSFGPMAPVIINAGGTLRGGFQNLGSVTLNGGLINGTAGFDGNNFTLSQNVTVGGSSASTIQGSEGLALSNNIGATVVTRDFNVSDATGNANADLTISNVVRNAHTSGTTSNLQKSGAGTMVLSGNSTYTGTTTVSVGTLLVNGSLGDTAVTVASGAFLGGSGTVGTSAVLNTLTVNGTLAPGNSPGILTVNDNLDLNGTLSMELQGTTAGSGYDRLVVNGTVDITGSSLSALFNTFTPVNGDLLFILLNDDTDAITGTFSGFAQNATVINYGGLDWKISYNADFTANTFTSTANGNDIALMAIPEPSAALLGGLGMLCLLRRRRA